MEASDFKNFAIKSIRCCKESTEWYVRKALIYVFIFLMERMFWIFVRIASMRKHMFLEVLNNLIQFSIFSE